MACHSEEQHDEESLRIIFARLGSRDFSLTSFARNDMAITDLFTTTQNFILPAIKEIEEGKTKSPN